MSPQRLLGSLLSALLLLTGCTQTQPPAAKEPPLVEAEAPRPDLPPDLYPPDFRTQDPKVDAVIDAFLHKDVDRLMDLVGMTVGACAQGTPFYCGDEPEGTVRSYFPWGSCQVNNFLTTQDEIRERMAAWVEESRYLFAVYRVEGMGDSAYYLIFAKGRSDHAAKTTFLNQAGELTELGLGCNIPGIMSPAHFHPMVPPK